MSRGIDTRNADAEARYRSQVVFDTPLVLRAGAGTGKTSALVARIVCWCLGEGWDRAEAREREAPARRERADAADRIAADVLSRVCAITFTEAAAAEMAERVGETLSALGSGELLPGLIEEALPRDTEVRTVRARALLGELDHLVVRTIHAFCRRLLARYPLESGVHPAFQVDADSRLQAGVIREVVEEETRRAYTAGEDSALLDCAVRGQGPRELEQALLVLLEKGVTPKALAENPFAPEKIRAALVDFDAGLVSVEESGAFRMEGLKRATRTLATLSMLKATRAALSQALSEVEAGSPEIPALSTLAESLHETWDEESLKRLRDWARGTFKPTEENALEGATDAVKRGMAACHPWVKGLREVQPENFDELRRALGLLLGRVDEELRRRGVATYASLLSGAREFLQGHPLQCGRIRKEMEQLLVDEFQDTDAVQCEIVRLLALTGPEEDRPGLFLVGDPKQSVYGWRSADLAAYDAFVQEVEAAGGEVHGLSVNFRSVPAILDEVERVVEPVMQREPGLQPDFEALDVCEGLASAAGFAQPGASAVEYWVSWGWDPETNSPLDALGAQEVVRREARALARDIRRQHDECGVAYRDMAVLMRSTGDVQEYLAALRDEGVPYAIERDRTYYRKREIIDACALVRCVLDPLDTVALLTWLRSPASGVPDAAWIPLWSREFPDLASRLSADPARNRELLGQLRDQLTEVAQQISPASVGIPGLEAIAGWHLSAISMLENLARLRESFARDAADLFVEKIRALSMLEITEAARYQGAFRAANLSRFFRELRADLLMTRDVQAVLRRLRLDVARSPDAEEEKPQRFLADVVPVMTIHRAKGLGFDHVYLPQLHKKPRPNGSPSNEVIPHGEALEFRLLGLPSLKFVAASEEQERVQSAERVRTLYVAMTRAKQRLVLMGQWKREPVPVAVERTNTHMGLLASRVSLPSELGPQMEALAEQGERHFVDDSGVLWAYPSLDRREPASASTVPNVTDSSVVQVDHAAVQRDAEELAVLRSRAEERMRRRFSGVASGLSPAGHRERSADLHDEWLADRSAQRDSHVAGDSDEHGAEVARLAGIAVHRALEEFALAAEPADELARQIMRLPQLVEPRASESVREHAVLRAAELLKRFGEGPLLERFSSLASSVVARELDVWVPGDIESDDQPVGFTVGTIDLLYREPETGEWVVVDYKTDRVDEEQALSLRAERYRAQGEVYAAAVQDALVLDVAPRFELWFLDHGQVVRNPGLD